jgi:hypothetical protein
MYDGRPFQTDDGDKVKKLFSSSLKVKKNKLACSSLESRFGPVRCLWLMLGAYPYKEPGYTPILESVIILTILKKLYIL